MFSLHWTSKYRSNVFNSWLRSTTISFLIQPIGWEWLMGKYGQCHVLPKCKHAGRLTGWLSATCRLTLFWLRLMVQRETVFVLDTELKLPSISENWPFITKQPAYLHACTYTHHTHSYIDGDALPTWHSKLGSVSCPKTIDSPIKCGKRYIYIGFLVY